VEWTVLAKVMVQWRAIARTRGEDLLKDMRNCHILRRTLAYTGRNKRKNILRGTFHCDEDPQDVRITANTIMFF
jgi:hypothetical protein